MADPTTVQQWTDQYNQLRSNLDNVNGAVEGYIQNGYSDSPALYEAQRLQLQLEYQLNQHIESAYTPELNDTYNTYKDSRPIRRYDVPIDGILYNNTGQPLA